MDSTIAPKAAILLSLIRGEGYGLEIRDRVRAVTSGQLDLGPGTLYPALKSLEASGMLESWKGAAIAKRGGRPRTYYRLTATGAEAAQQHGRTIASFAMNVAEELA